jgi:bifunctional non-homologous end joining protein LigD
MKKKMDSLINGKSPFKEKVKANTPITWIQPKMVCEVSFSEWTSDNSLRHPIFEGLREDKKAKDVVIEKPLSAEKAAEETGEMTIKKEDNQGKINVKDKEITLSGHKLKLTNLDKVFFPDEGYTKGDLIDYYKSISKYMLPYLKDRPESMRRNPHGIKGQSFFQKNVDHMPPSWVKTKMIYSESNDSNINYMLCNDEATLVYMANLGCIEINPWFSRIQALENPDYLVVDLDPEEISFDKVIETALVVKEVLDEAGAKSFCKTSGATGLHIYVPLKAKYDYEAAKEFAHVIARITNNRIPEFTSLERSPSKIKKKVYLDYLQNRKGQTLAAPYSVRPFPGATVAAPLLWEEVKKGLSPSQFTIKNIHERLKDTGDLFKGILGAGINIEKCLKRINSELRG